MYWSYFKPYVSVAQRQRNAEREAAKLAKKGQTISPVRLDGRLIATTFWGKAWCDNLESYSDFSNRLPRGRSYLRNGSVVDLQIHPGKVTALVSGSDLYTVSIEINSLAAKCWKTFKTNCAGQIGSLIELLQGKLSKNVLELVTHRDRGLFPKPKEIQIECSCPDWADLCKHAAAVLYGVGSRLDKSPELFFKLRKVDHQELVASAVAAPAHTLPGRSKRVLKTNDLADVFGIELADSTTDAATATKTSISVKTSKKKAVSEKPVAKPAKKSKRFAASVARKTKSKPGKVARLKSK